MTQFRVPQIMGIVNCTPDSFYSESRSPERRQGWIAAGAMIDEGADIIDIGGESTRPGSEKVSADDQMARVLPVIKEIRSRSPIPISIDTRSAEVAEAALDAGASMVNDVSALRDDPSMAPLVAERGIPVILMHMKGRPKTMQLRPKYADVVDEVRGFLVQRIDHAVSAGVREQNIIIDPGIGFGKRPEDNAALLHSLDALHIGSHSLLVGLSRKSFLGLILDRNRSHLVRRNRTSVSSKSRTIETQLLSTPSDRLTATLGAHAWCLTVGVDILRVHDVRETRELIAVWEAIAWAS